MQGSGSLLGARRCWADLLVTILGATELLGAINNEL